MKMRVNHMSDPHLYMMVMVMAVATVVAAVVVAVLQVALVLENWTQSNHNMEFPSHHQPHFVFPPK
jgi:hypothetical protein